MNHNDDLSNDYSTGTETKMGDGKCLEELLINADTRCLDDLLIGADGQRLNDLLPSITAN